MRFSSIHKLASYLMAGSAFAALALSRALHPALLVFTLVAGTLSYWAEPGHQPWLRARAWSTLWNSATVAVFLYTLFDALRGDPLLAGVRFLCFLLVNKLWNRRASRDYLQAYVVSFLMLVAGAALSADLTYALCFLGYVVFATWTLTLFHLRREMEENYLLKHSDSAQSERVEVERILNSRRIVGGSFLLGTSLVSAGVFIGSTLVFFLIPRFGFGLMSTGERDQHTTGFSERITLGQYGRVQDDPEVVMRIELEGGPPLHPLRMRGVSFDHYSGGRWSRSPRIVPLPLRSEQGLELVGLPPGQPDPKALLRRLDRAQVQHVYLEPLDTAVLFGSSMPFAFKLDSKALFGPSSIVLETRGANDVYAVERHLTGGGSGYTTDRKSGLKYTVYSDTALPSESALINATEKRAAARGAALRPYLSLPRNLPARIAELAHRLTDGISSPYLKARTLEQYLRRRYRYTLDLKPHAGYEPIDDFLFVARAGHCEYFASALAILLREVGIPSRSVNGFYGGEWNSYGNYVAMREGDAHAWVEAWFDGIGWVTLDPTPPAPRPSGGHLWHALQLMLDNVQLAWFKYVVEYDLGKQVRLLRGVGKHARALASGGLSTTFKARGRHLAEAAIALASIWIWLVVRRRGARSGDPEEQRIRRAAHAFERATRALARRGFYRAPGETGRELSARLRASADPGAGPFSELVEHYYAARFGGASISAETLDRLVASIQRPPEGLSPPAAPTAAAGGRAQPVDRSAPPH